jgi:hypothetical protein
VNFKSFDVVKGFIGREKVIQMVVEFDNRTLMPLLMAIFQFQNLSTIGFIEPSMVDDEKSIFGAMISNEPTLQGLLKNEMFSFHRLHVQPKDCLLSIT